MDATRRPDCAHHTAPTECHRPCTPYGANEMPETVHTIWRRQNATDCPDREDSMDQTVETVDAL